ncbi:sugar MFS transporter [Aliikangiella sp. G2MR2-5]|uniref:sugar MFS transporter n=1 Tax=Aliikangiella sp. G2MR2-5 TaxID=2788943 RepID=UPI0018ABC1A8|nr:sugar MFS transporter [Aliikangiella sp. G2MR2-5]
MASQSSSISASVLEQKSSRNSNRFALVTLTSLFFMWGFITCLNDILIPYLKASFELNYTQAMLIQFCFFGAYFVVSLPAGKLVGKIGFQRGIVTGLAIAAFGCLLFLPAAISKVYALFLFALFILASGITILQVSANPYVTALGSEETASSRLTLTQAFNSLGTTVAPFFGAFLIFSSNESGPAVIDGSATKVPYLILCGALVVLAIIFLQVKLPKLSIEIEKHESHNQIRSAWSYPHLVLGAIGIFVYVGAEVSIGSFLVNYFSQPDIGNLDEAVASKLIAYYWGGAMVGRFIGAVIMQKFNAGIILFIHALGAMFLVVLSMNTTGSLAMWSILAVGLFNSIMFPTIFSLAVKGLGKSTSHGSGILCLAIVGGAFVPLLQGVLADNLGIQMAFFLPAICYAYIAYYGLFGSRIERN